MVSLVWLLGCAIGWDSPGVRPLGTIGDARFWHEHPVQDVHVQPDGSLLSFAGCAVSRWTADGVLQDKTPLEGCTAGLNDGFFSPDGAWVAASGLWTGEQGVWRTSGGKRVHETDSITWSRFCGGALWDVDGSKGFRRLDLASGKVTHPSGDHGTGILCVGDAWMLDSHGHRIDLDGTVVELPEPAASGDVVGQTEDGRALVYLYDQRLVTVDRDGAVEAAGPAPDRPEKVMVLDGDLLVLDDGVDDVAWRIARDGRIVGGPWFAQGKGLGERSGMGALFVWKGVPWSWAGRRIFPLGEAAGPVDTTYERFFFDADELYLCHGSTCEARRLDALDTVRHIDLPDGFNDESKRSPHGRFLGQYDTRHLFRTVLDTGEVQMQPVDAWVDGLSIDATGHFKWRLSNDDDDDDVYVTRVFERRAGEDVVLGEWRERALSDPGWSVLQLGPTMRWPDGTKAGHDDADNWFETPAGLVFLATEYGSGLEVYDAGKIVHRRRGAVDTMGPWGDGAWVANGQKVIFLAADLTEKAQITVPWPLGDFSIEGAGSPDGRHFAARGPSGTLTLWRVGDGLPAAALPEPEAMTSWPPPVSHGKPARRTGVDPGARSALSTGRRPVRVAARRLGEPPDGAGLPGARSPEGGRHGRLRPPNDPRATGTARGHPRHAGLVRRRSALHRRVPVGGPARGKADPIRRGRPRVAGRGRGEAGPEVGRAAGQARQARRRLPNPACRDACRRARLRHPDLPPPRGGATAQGPRAPDVRCSAPTARLERGHPGSRRHGRHTELDRHGRGHAFRRRPALLGAARQPLDPGQEGRCPCAHVHRGSLP